MTLRQMARPRTADALVLTVRAAQGRLSALGVFLRKSVFYGAFVLVRRALKQQKRRFPTPRAAACLVHDLVTIVKRY
jgi:hypothetical protein